jgi:hypothetical protein
MTPPPMLNDMSWLTPPWHKLALPMERPGHTPTTLIVVLLYSFLRLSPLWSTSFFEGATMFFPCGTRHGRLQSLNKQESQLLARLRARFSDLLLRASIRSVFVTTTFLAFVPKPTRPIRALSFVESPTYWVILDLLYSLFPRSKRSESLWTTAHVQMWESGQTGWG